MQQVYGVFEGGGVCGTALIGAVKAAEEADLRFSAVAGSSAGAIVAALLAAGCSAQELHTLMLDMDYPSFKDPINRVPILRRFAAWRSLGLYRGDTFHRWISEKLSFKLKGQRLWPIEFRDLPVPLTIVATDVIRQQMRIFSSRLTPTANVADAVRMSMSIPFFFCPVRYGGELLVDGGTLSNFPAWAFEEDQKVSPLPILGLRLQPNNNPPSQIHSPLDLAKSLVSTMIKCAVLTQTGNIDRLYEIELPTLGVQVTDFDITPERKDQLFEAGYHTARAYLATTTLS